MKRPQGPVATLGDEVLEAKEIASLAYDAAKRAARLGRANNAHDELVAPAHRTQADALELEAKAKRRLADECDAAQERGEVTTKSRGGANIPNGVPEKNTVATAADIGLSRKDIHEAREIRDAEQAEPGIVRRTLDATLAKGEEPTRAKVKRAVKSKSKRKRAPKPRFQAPKESQHDRDLRALLASGRPVKESKAMNSKNRRRFGLTTSPARARLTAAGIPRARASAQRQGSRA